MILTLNASHAGLVASSQHTILPLTVPTAPVALRELMMADGGTADIGELIADARVAPVLIAPARSALEALTALTEVLARHEDSGQTPAGHKLDVLHIVARGRTGAFSLGGHWIDTATLARASGMLTTWRVKTIALWSCHVGQDSAVAQVLAALTGAAVLASRDALGMVDGAPRWSLDGSTWPAALEAPFARDVMARWPHQLAG